MLPISEHKNITDPGLYEVHAITFLSASVCHLYKCLSQKNWGHLTRCWTVTSSSASTHFAKCMAWWLIQVISQTVYRVKRWHNFQPVYEPQPLRMELYVWLWGLLLMQLSCITPVTQLLLNRFTHSTLKNTQGSHTTHAALNTQASRSIEAGRLLPATPAIQSARPIQSSETAQSTSTSQSPRTIHSLRKIQAARIIQAAKIRLARIGRGNGMIQPILTEQMNGGKGCCI